MSISSKYFNAFNLIDGIGPVTFKKLLSHFKTIEQAWFADIGEISKIGLERIVVNQIKKYRYKINPDKEFEKLIKNNINLITILDKDYPKLLKEIYSPPAVLYIRGKLEPNDEFSLGIVGSRLLSSYGHQAAPEITYNLAKSGLTIISGLAKGIDAIAHRSALKANGRTIAILGSGIDQQSIYPRINKNLADEIVSNGALISEFPIGTQPKAQHFPQRNRIISGLSLGVLLIEASQKSGSLITAKYALEQNRDVFAIPGSIFSQTSSGTNNLIKMGAKLVTEANDILEELNLSLITEFKENREILPDSKEEELILKELSSETIHIDKIINNTKLSTAIINSTLTLMELKGKVKNLGKGNYVTTYNSRKSN